MWLATYRVCHLVDHLLEERQDRLVAFLEILQRAVGKPHRLKVIDELGQQFERVGAGLHNPAVFVLVVVVSAGAQNRFFRTLDDGGYILCRIAQNSVYTGYVGRIGGQSIIESAEEPF
ncbi:MAG: hypothetical protein P4L84_04110 [Isosphaeraceae bacterium]|nr:hypothetical protein [Isosphaeraceae bacterium]